MDWDAKFEALTECRYFDWYLSFVQVRLRSNDIA